MSQSAHSETQSNSSKLWAVLPALTVFVATLAALSNNTSDPDLWGHVQYGRDVITSGSLPETTTWSYVVSDYPWVNHENLAELAMAWAAGFGVGALILGKLVLALMIVGSWIWWVRRHSVSWLTTGLVLVICGDSMRFHWHYRPQAFGYAFFALEILLLNWCFEFWGGPWPSWSRLRQVAFAPAPLIPCRQAVSRLRWLWLMPPLLCLWTNTHGGYAAGLAIFIAYIGLRGVEAWAWWGRGSSGLQRRFVMMLIAAGLGTCVNPYGPQLHLWLAEDVLLPRPEIGDWQPINLLSEESLGLWMLLALATVAAVFTQVCQRLAVKGLPLEAANPMVASNADTSSFNLHDTTVISWSRSRAAGLAWSLPTVVILALVLWQSLLHCRHLAFFAILCGFWLPVHVDSFLRRVWEDLRHRLRSNTGEAASTTSGFAVSGLLLLVLAVAGFRLVRNSKDISVDRSKYPVAAMQYLHDHKLYGRTVVSFNWAQYAIMCFAADSEARTSARVATDGRLRTCYPQEAIDIYLDFALGDKLDLRYRSPDSPPVDTSRALNVKSPDLVLLSRKQGASVRTMQANHSVWVMLYQDSLAQIWGRRSIFDTPTSPRHLAVSARSNTEQHQTGTTPWPALPVPGTSARLQLSAPPADPSL